ncbi:PhzF family phenazine biosynthesis protein [Streptomyces sp. GESEQ-4]|uniref:PhzF family phenazine biosynthesis protein n=1 Tax=Streptomyces sp. GESEQ-4 TaxID=2812655 RepID=UPI001B33A54C|nr:PhzF family phenazine biosynthesis protein [Streptomyces sp. GESEQ-4]
MHDYVIVDVFTTVALEGNPLAVFLNAADIPAARMQLIAREMNLSETTFVLPAQGDGDRRVRIFTPVNELPFAGHPVLGTAAVLGESTARSGLRLETAAGTIPVDLQYPSDGTVSARMRQPVPVWEPYRLRDDLLDALGIKSSTLPVDAYRNGPRHVYVGVGSEAALSRVQPDLRALARHPDMAAICFAGSGTRWRMRMFSPAYGVAEDAATGSAAGPLAVHLARYGLVPFGQQIEILQGVEMGRPSHMSARADATGQRPHTVEVSGSAVITAYGTLLV